MRRALAVALVAATAGVGGFAAGRLTDEPSSPRKPCGTVTDRDYDGQVTGTRLRYRC